MPIVLLYLWFDRSIYSLVNNISDFGFAQCIKETAKKNEVRGTLLYMAPEIFCEGFYHPSCDLWSIGIILYGELNGNFDSMGSL